MVRDEHEEWHLTGATGAAAVDVYAAGAQGLSFQRSVAEHAVPVGI